MVLNQTKCQSSSPFSPFLEKLSLPLLLILYFHSLWPSPCSLHLNSIALFVPSLACFFSPNLSLSPLLSLSLSLASLLSFLFLLIYSRLILPAHVHVSGKPKRHTLSFHSLTLGRSNIEKEMDTQGNEERKLMLYSIRAVSKNKWMKGKSGTKVSHKYQRFEPVQTRWTGERMVKTEDNESYTHDEVSTHASVTGTWEEYQNMSAKAVSRKRTKN